MIFAVDNEAARLAARYRSDVETARDDLYQISGLDSVVLDQGMAAFAAKESRPGVPSLTHVLPHIMSAGLDLESLDRRKIAAAWVAVNGYIALADHAVDSGKSISPQTFMSASALLAWSLSTLAQYTANTPFAKQYIDHINAALAGQNQDWKARDGSADRTGSDIDKNRAVVAIACAYAAAAGKADDRLPRAVLHILGPLQMLDDLLDLEEDLAEGNCTCFARMISGGVRDNVGRMDIYSTLFCHLDLPIILRRAASSLEAALILLDDSSDFELYAYIEYLGREISDLADQVEFFRRGFGPSEADLRARIGTIVCST